MIITLRLPALLLLAAISVSAATITYENVESGPRRPAPPDTPDYSQFSLASAVPTLADHPAQTNVPPGGMYYLLTNEVDATILELWMIRDSDGIATQLSAHDHEGNPIVRQYDAKSGVESVYNQTDLYTALSNANNFTQFKAAALGAFKTQPKKDTIADDVKKKVSE